MAFATKYRVQWADYTDIAWEIDLQEDGFGGSIVDFVPGGMPAKLSYNGSEKYQSVVGSNLDIQLVHQSEIDTLYLTDSHTIKVILKRNTATIWQGFLSPGQYYRDFNNPKHYVTLTATDGLGELKNIKFTDGTDPYWDVEREIIVIANILSKTDHALSIIEAVNMYDTNHSDTVATDSPLHQTYIYQEAYWDEQTEVSQDCYTVLSDILKKYGACIRQQNGYWLIIRANSYSIDSISYRVFSTSGSYASAGTITAHEDIDTDFYYVNFNQELYKQSGVDLAQVTQLPPRRENMFPNGHFSGFTWDGSAFDHWDDSASVASYSEDSGALKMGSANSGSIPTKYIETNFDVYYTDSIRISFDLTPTYDGSPTFKTLVLQIYNGSNYLTSSGWQGSIGYYSYAVGTSGEEDYITIDIPETESGAGFQRGMSMRFRIYEFYNENVEYSNYVHIDNLRMDVDMSLSDYKVHEYENTAILNSTNEIDIAIGDSWRKDYFPSGLTDYAYFVSTYNAGANLTSSWSIYGDPTAGAYVGEVLARQLVEGFRRGLDIIKGSIRGTQLLTGKIGIKDSDFTDEYGFDKRYFPLKVSFDCRMVIWTGEWIECPSTYSDESIEWASTDYDTASITLDEITVTNSDGDGTATSDTYTAVIGETVRVVIELTDNGSSDIPSCTIGGTSKTLSFGTNYLEETFSSSGSKTVVLGGDDIGDNHNFTAEITFYSITGI